MTFKEDSHSVHDDVETYLRTLSATGWYMHGRALHVNLNVSSHLRTILKTGGQLKTYVVYKWYVYVGTAFFMNELFSKAIKRCTCVLNNEKVYRRGRKEKNRKRSRDV